MKEGEKALKEYPLCNKILKINKFKKKTMNERKKKGEKTKG
jgi:hypothetical protein